MMHSTRKKSAQNVALFTWFAKGSAMVLHTGIAMTVNAIQAASQCPIKKLFLIDIVKVHLPLNSSLKSSVSPPPPLSANSRITPRRR